VLELADESLVRLEAVAVSRGPGSLTGLKVGIGTARGIATGAGKRLVGVSTLQALAAGMGPGPPVLALLDAGRGEVFGGLFRPGIPPEMIGRERIAPPSHFAEAVAGREIRIAGSGAKRYQDHFPQTTWLPCTGEEFLAAGVGRVAAALLGITQDAAGRLLSATSPLDAMPRYLRREPGPVRFEE
jgi:tRNA threonylcarbamoyl adenosine modification protein YeaZ